MNSSTASPLLDFGFYSQKAKKDGVAATGAAIEFILDQLPERNCWCVEFGAWDGLVGSTSRPLI
ncbi:MAG: hypothetical protein ABSF34_08180, partial [Verrucomicrobiota bacterium]